VVVNAFGRTILRWAMTTHLRTKLVLSAMEMELCHMVGRSNTKKVWTMDPMHTIGDFIKENRQSHDDRASNPKLKNCRCSTSLSWLITEGLYTVLIKTCRHDWQD
jgi:hypothetical protein